MKLTDIQQMTEQDMAIDDLELDRASLDTPQLHNKYLQLYTQEALTFRKIDSDFKRVYKSKWEYYTGKADPEVYKAAPFDLKILKQDVHMYLDADPELDKLQSKLIYQKEKINYLENILKSLNSRTFHIKNAIEWKKFTHGTL